MKEMSKKKLRDISNSEPVLIVAGSQGNVERFRLASFGKEYFTIGRDRHESDIVIPDSMVSGLQGYLVKKNGRFYYRDMNSRNGSYVESAGKREFLHNSDAFAEISEGSMIRIGSLNDPQKSVLIIFTYMEAGEAIKKHDVTDRPVKIGRSSECDIVLKHPSISRRHCEIERRGNEIVIRDSRSRNGLLVNGCRLEGEKVLRDKDIIQILGYRLIFCGGCVYYRQAVRGIAIRGRNISKWVGGRVSSKQILRDVSIDIEGNEFVAIIGGSGAGKSTLMNVINGSDKKFGGQVCYDGVSLETNFQHLKSLVGYVPQDDIIYENLKLRRMLYYTALMRMPEDTDKKEIDERIDSVLDSLDLKEHENTYIRKLSGGQKKRASIAVELLADPKLFFSMNPPQGWIPGQKRI